MKKIKLLILAFFAVSISFSQAKDDPITYDNALLISPIFSLQIPGGDFAKRFGLGYEFGFGLDYKLKKNWYLGGEGGFLFGTAVKETNHIKNTLALNGMIITDDGYLDEVNLNLRGGLVKLNLGKSFYFNPKHPNSGILVKAGFGYLQHKILIDVDKSNSPQLTGFYAKGYDRFSNGLLLSQYIGLVKLEKGKFVNLSFGFEITEGFTSNARPFDFYLGQKMTEKRVDLMYGLKLTWIIPVFMGQTTKNQYYTY